MDWFQRDRRGPEWKRGWTSQTISSISLPPAPLLAIFAIVILFLSISHYAEYKAQMDKTVINFQVFLLLIPVSLIFLVRNMSANANFRFRLPRPLHVSFLHQGGGSSSPWGVAALLLLLLIMISYKSSFDSQWFRPLRRSNN